MAELIDKELLLRNLVRAASSILSGARVDEELRSICAGRDASAVYYGIEYGIKFASRVIASTDPVRVREL